MAIDASEWIWLNDQWTRWEDANVHVTTHGLHYGSSAFEGIRAYQTPTGTAVFRLGAHIRRLFDSCKILRMEMPDYDQERIEQLCVEAVSKNELDSCYIRPIVFRGGQSIGLNPTDCECELAIFAINWGRYLGEEGIEQGIDAAVTSWRRFNANVGSPLGKIGGQYVTSQFVSVEARMHGYGEGLMLDDRGNVAEGAGENLFVIKDGEILTPAVHNSILAGITRDSVLTLAQDLGIPVRFATISRDMLYLADEMFLTGTAAEVTPVRSVDRIPVGNGSRGEITKAVQDLFFATVEGRTDDPHGWLTPVPQEAAVTT